MPAAATTLSNSLLNLVLRNVAYTPPANTFLALFSSPVTAAGGGTEVTGGSYARRQIAWNAAANGAIVNTADLAILGMPAVTVTHLAVMSAATGGVMLFYGALNPTKAANAGDTFTIRAGDLNVAFQ